MEPLSPTSPSEDPSQDVKVKQPAAAKENKSKDKTNIKDYEDLMNGLNPKEAEAKQ